MAPPRRRFLVVANFKSTGTEGDIVDLARSWATTHWERPDTDAACDTTAQVVVAPSFLHMHLVRQHLGPAARRLELCAQNVCASSGSHHTGEITTEMLMDSHVSWCIVGHSERRRDPAIHESDHMVAAKARKAIVAGMTGVIICVGETAQEREQGHAVKVVTSQLDAVASKLSRWDGVVVAYEPLWAIGTGEVASLDQVQEMHEALRTWIGTNVSPAIAEQTRIIYGGSVSAVNCEPLARLPDVDGFLVGGAAVRLVHSGTFPGVFSEFAAIVAAASAAHHNALTPDEPFDMAKPGTVMRGGVHRQEQQQQGKEQ